MMGTIWRLSSDEGQVCEPHTFNDFTQQADVHAVSVARMASQGREVGICSTTSTDKRAGDTNNIDNLHVFGIFLLIFVHFHCCVVSFFLAPSVFKNV